MVSAASKAASTSGDKPKVKRAQKTVEQQLEEAQARVEAIKAKAHSKDTKVIKVLGEKREALVTKITKLTDEVEDIDRKVAEAQANVAGPVTDGVGDAPESVNT